MEKAITELRQAMDELLGDDADMMDVQRPIDLNALTDTYARITERPVQSGNVRTLIVDIDDPDGLMDYDEAQARTDDPDLVAHWHHHDGADLFFADDGEIEALQYGDLYEMTASNDYY